MNPNSNFDPDEKDTSSLDSQPTELSAEDSASHQSEDTASSDSDGPNSPAEPTYVDPLDGFDSGTTSGDADASEGSTGKLPAVDNRSEPVIAPPETEPASQPMPAPVEENAATSAFASTPVTPSEKPPRKSKKMLIGSIVGLAAVLLLGGGTAAYALWYQNPQKVVTDSVVNMFKAKSVIVDGTMEIKNIGDSSSSVEKITLTLDSQATRSSGVVNAKLSVQTTGQEDYSLEGSALVDSDANLYFKVKNVEQLASEYMGFSQGSSVYTDQLIEKIDNKWIRIGAEDYEDISKEASETQKCFADTFKKFESDSKAQGQIADAYKANQFIVIEEELGTKDGNIGYVIDGDAAKAKLFAESLKETDIYKELRQCDDSFEIDTSDIVESEETDADVRFEVWVSQFGHELRQVKATVSDEEASGSFVLNTQFNQDVVVEAPSDFVSLKDLIDDIMNSFSEQMMGSYSAPEGQVDALYQTSPSTPAIET